MSLTSVFSWVIFSDLYHDQLRSNNRRFLLNEDVSVYFCEITSVFEFIIEEFSNLYYKNTRVNCNINFDFHFFIIFFVTFCNIFGILPFSVTLSASLSLVFVWSMSLFMLSTLTGVVAHGWGFFGLFYPAGLPRYFSFLIVAIEIVSYLARVVSLSVRLFANMMSGHALLKVLSTMFIAFIPTNLYFKTLTFILSLIIIFFVTVLETCVAIIQAYVFFTLSTIYFGDVLSFH